MSIIFPLAAFLTAFLSTRRSTGLGMTAVITVGYFSGVIRANFLDVLTTFMFDAAVLGLYIGTYVGRSGWPTEPSLAGRFVVAMTAWPALLVLIPINHFLVQFVALRATVWFLPAIILASRLTAADLTVMTRSLAILNLISLAAGIYIYLHGVEALYPRNYVTRIMYNSNDVAGHKYHRIPSTFLHAALYGGTMILTVPFLLNQIAGRGVRVWDRGLATAGAVAAAGGLMMCAARSPLVVLFLSLAIAWALTGFSPTLGLIGGVFIGCGFFVASGNERFQRISSLQDSDYVTDRIALSANSSFWDIVMEYPMGAGMGSSAGTSLPFFLADVAPEQIGLENEYSRILVDQGWVGLAIWLVFLGWLHLRPPQTAAADPWHLGVVLMYSISSMTWATAFLGVGLLASVPGAFLLMIQMGILAAVRSGGSIAAAAPFGPVTAPKPGLGGHP